METQPPPNRPTDTDLGYALSVGRSVADGPLTTEEHAYCVKLRDGCTKPANAAAFDSLIARALTEGVPINLLDLVFASNYHDAAKLPALAAIDAIRGRGETIKTGGGIRCNRCGRTSTVAGAVQTSSGDEPTKLSVRCLDCQNVWIIGDDRN